jgi:hypothetical protein
MLERLGGARPAGRGYRVKPGRFDRPGFRRSLEPAGRALGAER